MRRKTNNKLKQYLLELDSKYTVDELLPLINKKFKENYTRLELQKYLCRNKISYKYTHPNMSHKMGKETPIGTEYTKPDGRIMIKTKKNKWVYKSRYVYEKYYNVKLKEDEYIIFLDGNRSNCNIKNLKLVTQKEKSYIGMFQRNFGLKKADKKTTETLLLIAKLLIKNKQINKNL